MSHVRCRHALRDIFWLSVIFFAGLLVSAVFFYAGRAFDWKDAIISDLQSPEENPRGYLASAIATAIAGFFFLRLARGFHRVSSPTASRAAHAATGFFALGACGAIAIGALSPFRHSYDAVHIPLAFATFIALVAGLTVHLAIAAARRLGTSGKWSAVFVAASVFALAVLAVLAWLYFTPRFFTGETPWKTLALWEWLLCFSIVGLMLLLAWKGAEP